MDFAELNWWMRAVDEYARALAEREGDGNDER
jgi:hypothetical protein